MKALVAVISGGLLLLAVLSQHFNHAYTSDDVGIQNILESWRSGLPMNAVVGVDTFVLKWPVYLLVDQLLPNSRTAILAVNLIFAVIVASAVVGFTFFVHQRIAPRSRAALLILFLPVVWFLSGQLAVPDVTGSSPALLVPNGRNAEIAVGLLVVLAAVRLFEAPAIRVHHIVATVLVGVAIGITSVDDPYYLYILGVATLVCVTILRLWQRVSTAHIFVTFGGLVIAYLIMKIAQGLLEFAGILLLNNAPNAFVAAGDFTNGLAFTVSGLMVDFNAMLFGRPLNADVVPAVLNLLLLGVAALALVASLRRVSLSHDPLMLLLTTSTVVVIVAFASTTAATYTDHRFLYAVPFFLIPLIGLIAADPTTLARVPSRRIGAIALAVVAVILVNVGFNIRGIITANLPGATYAQRGDDAIIAALEANGVDKAYADYWHATIVTYLSSRDVIVLPVNCGDGVLARKNWLTNLSDYNIISTGPTGYVHGPKDNCTLEEVEAIIGESPSSVVDVPEAGATILIFDRDIGSQFAD